jgi:hypothetical protein
VLARRRLILGRAEESFHSSGWRALHVLRDRFQARTVVVAPVARAGSLERARSTRREEDEWRGRQHGRDDLTVAQTRTPKLSFAEGRPAGPSRCPAERGGARWISRACWQKAGDARSRSWRRQGPEGPSNPRCRRPNFRFVATAPLQSWRARDPVALLDDELRLLGTARNLSADHIKLRTDLVALQGRQDGVQRSPAVGCRQTSTIASAPCPIAGPPSLAFRVQVLRNSIRSTVA